MDIPIRLWDFVVGGLGLFEACWSLIISVGGAISRDDSFILTSGHCRSTCIFVVTLLATDRRETDGRDRMEALREEIAFGSDRTWHGGDSWRHGPQMEGLRLTRLSLTTSSQVQPGKLLYLLDDSSE